MAEVDTEGGVERTPEVGREALRGALRGVRKPFDWNRWSVVRYAACAGIGGASAELSRYRWGAVAVLCTSVVLWVVAISQEVRSREEPNDGTHRR